MRRSLSIAVLILVFALVATVVWVSNHLDSIVRQTRSQDADRSAPVFRQQGAAGIERSSSPSGDPVAPESTHHHGDDLPPVPVEIDSPFE